jgi:hypothetical protein
MATGQGAVPSAEQKTWQRKMLPTMSTTLIGAVRGVLTVYRWEAIAIEQGQGALPPVEENAWQRSKSPVDVDDDDDDEHNVDGHCGEQHHGTGDAATSGTLLEYRCKRPCLIKSTSLLGEELRPVLGFSDIEPCDSGSRA